MLFENFMLGAIILQVITCGSIYISFQFHPFLHFHSLRSSLRIDSGFFQRFHAFRQGSDRIPEHLPPSGHGVLHEPENPLDGVPVRKRFAETFNVQHRRLHVRRRQKGISRHMPDQCRLAAETDEGGQYSFRSFGADGFRHFALDEERQRSRRFRQLEEETPEEGRGDGVGNIRDDFEGSGYFDRSVKSVSVERCQVIGVR